MKMVKEMAEKLIYIFFLFLDQFSSFQLSSDGSKLLYIAEKKVPDSTSYFKKDNGTNSYTDIDWISQSSNWLWYKLNV